MNAAMPLPGLFEQREASLAALNELARKHWLNGMVHSQGTLEPRLAALVGLRRDLFAGKSPPANDWRWPPPAIAHALAAAIDELGLARYCAGQRELSDTVLMSILFHLDFIVDYADRGAGDDEDDGGTEQAAQVERNQFPVDRLAVLERDQHVVHQVLRIRRLLERLPELAKLIAGLGRARRTDEDDPSRQQTVEVIEQATALLPIARSQHIPDMPGETRGVRRSDRIARMLPAEAMLLAAGLTGMAQTAACGKDLAWLRGRRPDA